MTISQYYSRASRGSSNSSTTITQQQLADIIKNLKEQVRNEFEEEHNQSLDKLKQELKDAIKIEFSQMGSQYSPLIQVDLQALGACVSTKGSNVEITVNPSGDEHHGCVISTMGLYVQRENCTVLMALGKICEGGSCIHNVAYADDVVKVTVEKFLDGDAQVPFPTLEIQYVKQTLQTFIAWPANLVKIVS